MYVVISINNFCNKSTKSMFHRRRSEVQLSVQFLNKPQQQHATTQLAEKPVSYRNK